MIRVLVVEDSPVVRDLLLHILQADPEVRVIGTAPDGEAALAAVARFKPDVITMDIHMPRLDGFETTRRIMESHPTPIVVVSGSSVGNGVGGSFRALEAGALAVVSRPTGPDDPHHAAAARELLETVKLMSEVRVVRRWARRPRPAASALLEPRPGAVRVIAIGASTGGPPVLKAILGKLPPDFPAAILVVQHIAKGFTSGFVEWLGESCALEVSQACDGDRLGPGRVLVGPDGYQLCANSDGSVSLTLNDPENGHRPSVSFLFRSVADAFGAHAVGVLLTGMGRDGADELRLIRERGGVTIAQDAESSVVDGMPGEARRVDAAQVVASPDRIAEILLALPCDLGRFDRPEEPRDG